MNAASLTPRTPIFKIALVALALGLTQSIANAQSKSKVEETAWRAIEAEPVTGGDLRAPSPKVFDRSRQGFFTAGIGPAFGTGFQKDDLMYNLRGSYAFNMDDRWTIKGLADLTFGAGRTVSRMFSAGVGADLFLQNLTVSDFGVPYFSAQAGFGSARNESGTVGTGLEVGGGAGFQFRANELNWDVGLHYAILTQELDGSNPQVTSLRAAVNF